MTIYPHIFHCVFLNNLLHTHWTMIKISNLALIQCGAVLSRLTLCDPMDHSPPGSSVHGDSPGKNTAVGCHALLQGNLSNPKIEPRFPTLQTDPLPSEPFLTHNPLSKDTNYSNNIPPIQDRSKCRIDYTLV